MIKIVINITNTFNNLLLSTFFISIIHFIIYNNPKEKKNAHKIRIFSLHNI